MEKLGEKKKNRKFCSVRKFKTLQYLLAIKGSCIKSKKYSRQIWLNINFLS